MKMLRPMTAFFVGETGSRRRAVEVVEIGVEDLDRRADERLRTDLDALALGDEDRIVVDDGAGADLDVRVAAGVDQDIAAQEELVALVAGLHAVTDSDRALAE